MKRDWNLIRMQLEAIERDDANSLFSDLGEEPKHQNEMSWEEYDNLMSEYKTKENLIFDHLKLSIDDGYIDGVYIQLSADGIWSRGLGARPRLTSKGHDLISTIRSKDIWNVITETAKKKGIELTFSAISELGKVAIKNILS